MQYFFPHHFLRAILCFAAVSLFGLRAPVLPAENITIGETGKTVRELFQTAASENVDLQQAYRSLRQAQRDIESPWTIKNTTLSAEMRYQDTASADDGIKSNTAGTESSATPSYDRSLSSQAGLSVPLFPQVQLGGNVVFPAVNIAPSSDGATGTEEEIAGSISLSLSPFAEGKDIVRSNETYGEAIKNVQFQTVQLAFAVESAYLDYLSAAENSSYLHENMEFHEESYSMIKRKHDLGESTIREVGDVFEALTTARQDYFAAEEQLLQTEKTLRETVGSSEDGLEIASITGEELKALISERSKRIEEAAGLQPQSRTIENLASEKRTLEAELERTWTYRPDVQVNASVSLPEPAFSTGLSFSFSPADIKISDRKTIRENIQTKEELIEQESASLALEKERLSAQMKNRQEMITLYQAALEDSLLTLEEEQFFAGEGERTPLELQQAELTVIYSRIKLFDALRGLYMTQADVLSLYPYFYLSFLDN